MLDKKDELKKEELEEVNGGKGPKIQLTEATAGLVVAVPVIGSFAQKQNDQKCLSCTDPNLTACPEPDNVGKYLGCTNCKFHPENFM